MTQAGADCPAEINLALAYTPAIEREKLGAFFALDGRLGQLVSKATEPMLGQMRLAWWRDTLAMPVNQRPAGDPVLDGLSRHWSGDEDLLTQTVDSWELLVAEETLDGDAIRRFGEGRAAPFTALVGGELGQERDHALQAGTLWALMDAAVKVSDEKEREIFIETARDIGPGKGKLPRSLRGLAILEALSRRSLKAGGRPLMDGRGAGALAFKVGLLGR